MSNVIAPPLSAAERAEIEAKLAAARAVINSPADQVTEAEYDQAKIDEDRLELRLLGYVVQDSGD